MPSAGASIFDFITDDDFRNSLESDYGEMARCRDAGAWKAVHVLAGSMVEAVLIDYLASEALIDQKQALSIELAKAISLAKEHDIISARAADLSSVVRDYRNLIHPGRMKRLGDAVTADTAQVAQAVVAIIVEEVSKRRLLCPTGALDMTPFLEAMEEMTVGFRPKMTECLAEAEKGGRLRRPIPFIEIDTTRTGYKHYTVHPQWILGKGPQKGMGSDPAT